MKWKEKAEEEIYDLLVSQFGKENIQSNPKCNEKRADFFIKNAGIYIEVYSIKDITSDIAKVTQNKSNISIIQEFPREKMLDRLARKIQHELDQLPEGAKNVLIVKSEDPFVLAHEVLDTLMEPILVVNKETLETNIQYRHWLRTEEEYGKILEKISAMVVYEKVCPHGKLLGIFADNRNNARFPLTEDDKKKFSEMICHMCVETPL